MSGRNENSDLPVLAGVTEGLNVNMALTKDDLLAVKISDEETQLQTRLRVLSGEHRKVEKSFNELQQEICKSLNEMADAVKDEADGAIKALEKLGMTKVVFQAQHSSPDWDKGRFTVTLRLVSIGGSAVGSNYSGDGAAVKRELGVPAPLARCNDRLKELTKEREEIEAQTVDVRRALADLPTLERQARAAFARMVLNGSENGKKLLEGISGVQSIRQLVEALPAPKSRKKQ